LNDAFFAFCAFVLGGTNMLAVGRLPSIGLNKPQLGGLGE
jgi:hypothetical protein